MENTLDYDLELEKAVEHIKSESAQTVCVQLPDGLKPLAGEISEKLEAESGARIIVWLGSCWGACDVPVQVENLGVDLIIQWGHSEWD